MPRSLVEEFANVQAINPKAGGSDITGDYVNVGNATHLTIVANITQGNAATVALTIEQATAAAGTGSKVITENVFIWANQDTATSDLMTRQTDDVDFTTSAALANKKVVFDVPLTGLDRSYPWVCLKAGASNAANIIQADYFLRSRYAPSATVIA